MKQSVLFFVFFALLSTLNAYAQYSFDWMESAGNFAKSSVMGTVDSADNVIVTGYWQNYQMFTRKLDQEGNLLWEVADATGIPSKYVKPNWVNCDASNNVLVIGNQYTFSSSTNWDYPEAIVAIKYSPSGELIWKTVIPITITLSNLHRFNAMSQLDTEGNLYIGTAIDIPSGAVLYKLNQMGEIVFTVSSTNHSPHNFNSMRVKGDQVVLATGSTISDVAPVFVWNTNGDFQWSASTSGRGATDVEIDDSGNVYVLSHLFNQNSNVSGADFIVSKLSADANELWSYNYDLGGNEFPTRFALANNRLSIIGYGQSTLDAAYFDWKVLQLNTDGVFQWSNLYDQNTVNDEQPYYLVAKTNGEVIVTGKGGPSPDPNNPSYLQMIIVQYDQSGNQIWMDNPNIYGGWGVYVSLASDGSLYAVSTSDMTAYHYNGPDDFVETTPLRSNTFKIYPNPAQHETYIEFTDGSIDNASIEVYNGIGELLTSIPSEEILLSQIIRLDISQWNSGVYFISIKTSDSKEIQTIIKY